MSLYRFFLENQILADELDDIFELELSEDDRRHVRVLRLKEGEHIAVIDASSDYFECEIIDFASSTPVVRIASHKICKKSLPKVTLFQGIAKGDKVDQIIRHATEIGVDEFFIYACERSIVKLDEAKALKRLHRWESIASSAAKQSGRMDIPKIRFCPSFNEACSELAGFKKVIVYWEEAAPSCNLHDSLEEFIHDEAYKGPEEFSSNKDFEDGSIAVVVGPEGGLSPKEVENICDSNPNASIVTLGSNILRTETAGIVGSALVIYELGGLGAA